MKTIDVKTAKRWLDSGEAIMIDIREKSEHAMMHIEGVQLLPKSCFNVNQLPELSDKKLIIMCHMGPRGVMVCGKIEEDTGVEAYNLEGGIMGWYKNNLPVIECED